MEKQTLEKLADLARLNINPEEYAELEVQIGGIISLVDTVQQVSIDKKESGAVGAQINIARADIVESYTDPKALVHASSGNDGEFIKVPKVL